MFDYDMRQCPGCVQEAGGYLAPSKMPAGGVSFLRSGAEPGSSLARFKENLGATLRFTHELRAEPLPVSQARRFSADAVRHPCRGAAYAEAARGTGGNSQARRTIFTRLRTRDIIAKTGSGSSAANQANSGRGFRPALHQAGRPG